MEAIHDFDLNQGVEPLGKLVFTRQPDAEDQLLDWIPKLEKCIKKLQSNWSARLQNLIEEKGFIRDDSYDLKDMLALTSPSGEVIPPAPLLGTEKEKLIGKEAQAVIRAAEKMEMPKVPPPPIPEGPAASFAERKSELVVDTSALLHLKSPRSRSQDTWLDLLRLVPLAESTVERIVVPSIVADWEIRNAILRYAQNGVVLDPVAGKRIRDDAPARFFNNATRVRIEEDGTETLIHKGNPKLVIIDSPYQQALYDQLRDWKKETEENIQHKKSKNTLEQELKIFRDETAANWGENACLDYCRSSACKYAPIILLSDYNAVHAAQFKDKYVHDPLMTPAGHSIGFCTTKGFINDVCDAFSTYGNQVFKSMRLAEAQLNKTNIHNDIKKDPVAKDIWNSAMPDHIGGRKGKRQDMRFDAVMQVGARHWEDKLNITGMSAATAASKINYYIKEEMKLGNVLA